MLTIIRSLTARVSSALRPSSSRRRNKVQANLRLESLEGKLLLSTIPGQARPLHAVEFGQLSSGETSATFAHHVKLPQLPGHNASLSQTDAPVIRNVKLPQLPGHNASLSQPDAPIVRRMKLPQLPGHNASMSQTDAPVVRSVKLPQLPGHNVPMSHTAGFLTSVTHPKTPVTTGLGTQVPVSQFAPRGL